MLVGCFIRQLEAQFFQKKKNKKTWRQKKSEAQPQKKEEFFPYGPKVEY